MSEKLKIHEQDNKPEELDSSAHHERIKNDLEKAAEKQRSKNEELESLRESIEQFKDDKKEKSPIKTEEKTEDEPIDRAHKNMTYRATMRRIESRLPKYQRAFSKVINNEKIDQVSNVASKTVARPSAILGGGIAAVVGLSVVTYYANKIGFALSGSEFIFLTLGGAIAGIVFEIIFNLVKKIVKK